MENTCGSDDDDHVLHLPLPLLPEGALIQILVWLPVVSLLRFKSVCRSWRDLIQSSFFINLHTATTFNYDTFIFQTFERLGGVGEGKERKMFMVSTRSGSGGGSEDHDDQMVFKVDDIGFPSSYKFLQPWGRSIRMVGSCNGLICLHDSKRRVVSLWNPATRQFRFLPKSIAIEEELIYKFLADFVTFGVDVKTKDYKVMKITCFTPSSIIEWWPENICRVQVYSLSTDSWRLLEDVNSLPVKPAETRVPFFNQGVYLNGRYFFLGDKLRHGLLSYEELCQQPLHISNSSLMVSFDFTKETFSTMQLPEHESRHFLDLSYLGDKIALTTLAPSSTYDQSCCCKHDRCDIWVLNELGNKESWIKLHSFRITANRVFERASRVTPRGILNNGEFALIETTVENDDVSDSERLHLLNLVTKEVIRTFPISDRVIRTDLYKQSLVSINKKEERKEKETAADRMIGGAM